MIEFFSDTSNWLFFSFLVFAFALWKGGKSMVLSMIDGRIDDIREKLATAETLRVEAQELLAQYQRKHRDASKEAHQIIANAEKHAKELRKQAEKHLEEMISRREVQLEERLARMEQDAIHEVKARAAELAIAATQEIIAQQTNQKTHGKLIDDAIKNVGKNIH